MQKKLRHSHAPWQAVAQRLGSMPVYVDCYEMNQIDFPEGISCGAFVEMSAGEYCGIMFLHENCVGGESKLYTAGRQMLEQFKTFCPDCIGIISDITSHFTDVQKLYQESRKMLEYLYAYETPQLFVDKELRSQIRKGVVLEKEFKEFGNALEKEQLMESEVALDILLERSKKGRSIWEYTDDVQNVYRILKEYVQKNKINLDSAEIEDSYPAINLLEKALYAWVNKILYEMRERREQHYSVYVIDAVKYIQRNYAKDISIADIAEAANVSEGHLRRCFKQEMNCRVVNYLMDCRLDHAKQLMGQQNLPLDEIWKQTGFTSAQYFSYAFKQKEGISPREYAKKVYKG